MTPDDLAYVADLVCQHTGVVIRSDKGFFIETRLMAVARREKSPGVKALLDQLRRFPEPNLIRQVVEATLMQETSFFRDRKVFDMLRQAVLPDLRATRQEQLRVLCAGCGTGQEAYSIAMLAAELMSPDAIEVVAIDYGGRLLEKARTGLYSHFEVQHGLPIRQLLTHFDKVEDSWRVRPSLRQSITWVEHNLLDEMNRFGQFDLILCRNVLSSLTRTAAQQVIDALDACCQADGVLVVGVSEDLALPAAYGPGGGPGMWRRNPVFERDAAWITAPSA